MTYTKLRPHHLPDPVQSETMSVQLDKSFTCAGRGHTILTFCEEEQDWWFACDHGRHFLDGQAAADAEGKVYFAGIYLDN